MPTAKKYVVALHGAGMHGGVWGGMLTGGLSFPLRTISLPGHGAAGGSLCETIEEMATWVKGRLEDDHPPRSVILMGHSMGALVALEAASHPTVCAVVLAGASARMPVNAELLRLAEIDPAAAAKLILKWGVSPENMGYEEICGFLKAQMQEASPEALAKDLHACNNYRAGEETARALACPTLVLAGSDDKLVKPAEAQALAHMIPGGRFFLMKETGHMMMAEKPIEMAEEINAFLATLED